MRPVSNEFPDSQQFGEGATAGVAANSNPNSGMGYYVWLYGNYQPFGHAGKDIACPIGTPIYAPADGTVLYAGWTEDLPGNGDIRKWLFYYNFGGIITVIQHDGWISAIAHQSDNDAVSVGMRVKEGQFIGKSGNTKTRTTKVAPHVHIEALAYMDYRTDVRNGIIYGRVDPQQFFGGLAAAGSIQQEEQDMGFDPGQQWYADMVGAQARMDKRSVEMYDRIFGRDVQRWYNPSTNEVRTDPFVGGIPARSTDVHDVLATNNLVVSQTNKILEAISKIPGVDASVIASLRAELSAELKAATEGLQVTLVVQKDEVGK